MSDRAAGGSEQAITGHLWWGNTLEVGVHDIVFGRTYRVQFERAIDGVMKHSGGGGYRHKGEERFDVAVETASQWVKDTFGVEIIGREDWWYTKTLRGIQFNDRQEFEKLSPDELEQLARLLRKGEISLGDDESSDNYTTDNGRKVRTDGGERTGRSGASSDLRSDGGLPDDHSMRCWNCERVVHRRHIGYHEVPICDEHGSGYDLVPVPLCEACQRRWFGVECPNCGDYHWGLEGVVECQRDRPRVVPDGGSFLDEIERRCIWCDLKREGCCCQSPEYVEMVRCADCERWRRIDDTHSEMRDGEEVSVCSTGRCAAERVLTDGGVVRSEDPHEEPLAVYDRDGLALPEDYICYEGGLVVRTPKGTTVLTPREFGGVLDTVRPSDFGEVNRLSVNGHLAPDRVQLKKYGEEPEVYRVEVSHGG